jgi:hypothetical protein
MRPALVRAGALLAILLAISLALAPAAPAARPGHERQLTVQMQVGSFQIELDAQEAGGKDYALLYLSRRDQFAEYIAPAKFTDSAVEAKFGSFGELDYSFAPKGSAVPGCFGAPGSEAALTGKFTFTGEHGYVHIDADHASGFYKVEPEPNGCEVGRPDRAATAARAVPFQPYVGDGATLSVSTKSMKKNGVRRRPGISIYRGKSAKQASVTAVLAESRRGVSSFRGVMLSAPARAFEWDFGAYTATVAPPAPFTGTAKLVHHPDGSSSFTGSLRVPILGEPKPVRMAGRGFRPKLIHGTPNEP